MRAFEQRLPDLLGRRVHVDPVDLGPWSHHLAHRSVGEADDARDHRSLILLEHARGLRLGDHQVKFLRGHLVP